MPLLKLYKASLI